MTNRRPMIAVALLTLVVSACSTDPSEEVAAQPPTSSLTSAPIEQGTLSSEREFRATVGFGDTWSLNSTAAGTVTGRHQAGTVVSPGDELIRVDDRPITLARGVMPMYRELSLIDTRLRDEAGDRLQLLDGYDVIQLQHFLLDGGFDADGDLKANATFDKATEKAVKDWQASIGLPQTGRIDSSTLVFHPAAVRIADEPRIGDPYGGLLLSDADASVHVDTSNRDRAALPLDSQVTVEVAGTDELTGTVTKQEQVTAADGSTVWRTTIAVEAGRLTEAGTATITATDTVAENVLHAPVASLIALAEGGYAVELSSGGLVAVDVGEILDGRAEIRGNVSAGESVVVPT